jgi:hypothetical protein
MLTDADTRIRRLNKIIQSSENNQYKCRHKIHKAEYRLLEANQNPHITTSARNRFQAKLNHALRIYTTAQETLAYYVREHDAALRHKQYLQTLPLGQYHHSQHPPQPLHRSLVATVMVRILSGDLVQIQIDMDQPIIHLMEQFIRQRHFNPAASKRLVFFIDGEDQPFIAYQHSHERVNQKWSEVFSESLPVFHLLIQNTNESPQDIQEKVHLIRTIAEKLIRVADITDEEIYTIYNEWILTYIPPPKSNRYITMSAFVQQHLHLFHQMDLPHTHTHTQTNHKSQ